MLLYKEWYFHLLYQSILRKLWNVLTRLSVRYFLYRHLVCIIFYIAHLGVRYEIYTLAFPFDLRCQSDYIYIYIYIYIYTYYINILTYLLLYKAEMTSVCLSDCHADSSVVYAWIDMGLGLCRAVVSGM